MKNSFANPGEPVIEGQITPYDAADKNQQAANFEIIQRDTQILVHFERGPSVCIEVEQDESDQTEDLLKVRGYIEGHEAPLNVVLPAAKDRVAFDQETKDQAIAKGHLQEWNQPGYRGFSYVIGKQDDGISIQFNGGQRLHIELSNGDVHVLNYIEAIDPPVKLLLPAGNAEIIGRQMEIDQHDYDIYKKDGVEWPDREIKVDRHDYDLELDERKRERQDRLLSRAQGDEAFVQTIVLGDKDGGADCLKLKIERLAGQLLITDERGNIVDLNLSDGQLNVIVEQAGVQAPVEIGIPSVEGERMTINTEGYEAKADEVFAAKPGM
jgi:hypothetical protein